jgi:hypothetical protein
VLQLRANVAPAVQDLARRFRGPDSAFDFFEVPTAQAPTHAAAVDGSSAILCDCGGLAIEALRVATAWTRHRRVEVEIGDSVIRLRELSGESPTLEDARETGEAAAALSALQALPAGGVLLLDGTVSPGLAGALSQRGRERRVAVACVAKTTAEVRGGLPLFAAARRAARRARAAIPWATAIGPDDDRFAVRLSAAQDRLFLVRLLSGDRSTLGAMAALGNNPGMPGYPYLLALAHQRAAISEEEQNDMVQTILAEAQRDGLDAEELELAFHDYHEELDLGA